jgi:hypothetical protein
VTHLELPTTKSCHGTVDMSVEGDHNLRLD